MHAAVAAWIVLAIAGETPESGCGAAKEVTTAAACMSIASERGATFFGMAWAEMPVGCIYSYNRWVRVVYYNILQPGKSVSDHPPCDHPGTGPYKCLCKGDGGAANTSSAATPARAGPAMNAFFSGNDAVGVQMHLFLYDMAVSQGIAYQYQSHVVKGASMRRRMNQGLYSGQMRDGAAPSFNMFEEIQDAQGLAKGAAYDTLIVAETAPLYNQIQWESTLKNAGAFYDLLFMSPAGKTVYLSETWPAVPFSDFAAWKDEVGRDAPLWECVASVVNLKSGREEAPMRLLRVAQALSALVDLVSEGKVPDVHSPKQLFVDDAHLSNTGSYYVALFHYAVLFQRSPVGLPREFTGLLDTPVTDMPSAAGAAALQNIAWMQAQRFVGEALAPRLTSSQCVSVLKAPCNGEEYCEGLIDDAVDASL